MSSKTSGTGRIWRNWSGTAQSKPSSVVAPESAAEVASAVTEAAARGGTVRMVGAGHSFTSVAAPEDVMLIPRRLNAVRSVDTENHLISVDAGIDLTTLCHVLDAHGLALINMGDIRVQTVAGAIQTGTHGTGRDSGTFADMVQEIEIVTADGEVRTASREHDPDLFMAARVGLGSFGILTGITLKVAPKFRLQAHEFGATFDKTTDMFDEWTAEHDHVEFYWFPHTEGCMVKHNDRTQNPPKPLGKFKSWFDDEFLANTVFGALCKFTRAAPGYTPLVNRVSANALSERTFTDDSWKVFTSTRNVKFQEMEYNVPREQLLPALREVKKLLDNGPWRISFPIEVRSVPADDAWLSPASKRDSGYIAVHAFNRMDRDWFKPVEDILRAHSGRPHWGKMHTRTLADIAPAYPNFQQALDVRNRVDPNRVFANAYSRTMLGE